MLSPPFGGVAVVFSVPHYNMGGHGEVDNPFHHPVKDSVSGGNKFFIRHMWVRTASWLTFSKVLTGESFFLREVFVIISA